MAEYRITHRTVLAGRPPIGNDDVFLSPLPEGHVIQVLGLPERSKVPAPSSASAVYGGAPGQWFVVGDAPLSQQALAEYLSLLPPGAFGLDQSHGRVRMRVRGRMAERVLAKGTGVDLALASFPVGHGTNTLLGHIAAHMARTDTSSFDLMVLRGFAESLWEDLARMSEQFI